MSKWMSSIQLFYFAAAAGAWWILILAGNTLNEVAFDKKNRTEKQQQIFNIGFFLVVFF
jgi:protein-S-isoprenylcysteine O-methyltransferase Ste14